MAGCCAPHASPCGCPQPPPGAPGSPWAALGSSSPAGPQQPCQLCDRRQKGCTLLQLGYSLEQKIIFPDLNWSLGWQQHLCISCHLAFLEMLPHVLHPEQHPGDAATAL